MIFWSSLNFAKKTQRSPAERRRRRRLLREFGYNSVSFISDGSNELGATCPAFTEAKRPNSSNNHRKSSIYLAGGQHSVHGRPIIRAQDRPSHRKRNQAYITTVALQVPGYENRHCRLVMTYKNRENIPTNANKACFLEK